MAYIGSKPANKPVVASDLDPTVITGQTALAVAPADTDEFLISDGGVLKRLDASLIGGGGKVLQVVQGKLNTHPSTNANSWVTTGLAASITPSATSSKIFILITVGAVGGSNTTAFRIWKGSSHLTGASGNTGGNREAVAFRTLIDASDGNHAQGGGYNYLDSPSTTDATTYTLYWKNQSSQTSTMNYASSNTDTANSFGSLTASTITLMEIAG